MLLYQNIKNESELYLLQIEKGGSLDKEATQIRSDFPITSVNLYSQAGKLYAYDSSALFQFNEEMSEVEQLMQWIVGHMSKRTASYLLESKILPSRHTNKKTRCYFIKKKDIIELFDDMEKNPQKYVAPPKWYSENTKMKVSPYMLRYTPFDPVNTDKLREYYSKQLKPYDNILSVTQVASFTGYKSTTVTSWIRTGKMEALQLLDRYIIPKALLLDWLTSDRYNAIERKSKPHVRALWSVYEPV